MSKLFRAGLEAVTTIVVTLSIIVGAFAVLFGVDELLALSGIYYVIWIAVILVTHLALAMRRRHIRLGVGVATGVAVMAAHLVMFLTGNIGVDINIVPVILHDFGFALVAMIVLNIVHLVLFRRRPPAAAAAPVRSQRVDDIPAPVGPRAAEIPEGPEIPETAAAAEPDSAQEPQRARSA